jgi:hypothetical protein
MVGILSPTIWLPLTIDIYIKFIKKNERRTAYYSINVVVDSHPQESSSTKKTSGFSSDKYSPSSSSLSNLIVVLSEVSMSDEELNSHLEYFTTNINHAIH